MTSPFRAFPGVRSIGAMLLLSIVSSASAQLDAYYSFRQSPGFFSDLGAGSTILFSGNGINDQVSAAIAIPTFHFNETSYTQIYVSANGFITFGTAPAGTNYTPLSSGAGYAAAVSAFGANIQARNGGSRVLYQQLGDEFVIEWRNMKRFGLSEGFSFQIRLNSSTRAVSVVYGGVAQGPDAATTLQPQVGIRGASNAFPNDVMNRTVGAGAETWNTSLVGAANNSTMRFTSAAPAKEFTDGLTYTWAPTVLYSTTSGNMIDDIWAFTPGGAATTVDVSSEFKVVIQSGDAITVTGLMTVGDLDLENGATLNIGQEQRLVIAGDEVLLNGLVQGIGELSLEGFDATTVSITGTIALGDLIVTTPAGTTLQGDLDIINSLRLEDGVFDATAANVRLISTATRTARLGTVAPSASYLGELTMQRYIPGGATNWRLLGSSTDDRTVADWNDDFFTAGFPGSNYPPFYVNGELWPSIRYYDEMVAGPEDAGLVGVTSTAHVLQPGRGFAVWSGDVLGGTQPFLIDVKGEPKIAQTPFTLPMSYTSTGTPSGDGWNLVSNPLPSPIAFNQIVRGADVHNFYWIYNPANGTNAVSNGVIGTNGANGIIQSSQGFWLKANGPVTTTTVDENAKVTGNTGGLFGGLLQEDVLPLLRLKISSGLNAFSDETVVVFTSGTPGEEEGDVETFIFSHPDAPHINSRSANGADLAINMYGEFTEAIEIPIIVSAPLSGSYTITAAELEGIDQYSCLILEDLITGTLTPLTDGASYGFEISATDDATVPRFLVHASAPVQYAIENVSCHGESTGEIVVTSPFASAFDLIVMDQFGEVIATQEGVIGSVSIGGLSAGDLMVNVSSDAGCGALIASISIEQPYALEASVTTVNASCAGIEDGMLEVTVLGGVAPYAYSWSNGTADATVVGAAGSYSVLVSDANGCELSTNDLVIGAAPTPEAGFELIDPIIYTNTPIEILNTSTSATSYLWDLGDGTTSTEAEPQHIYAQPGIYTITLTATNGECVDVYTTEVTVEFSTGISDQHISSANVWTDGTSFLVDHGFTIGVLQITISDASGRIHAKHQISIDQGRISLPAADYSSGVWFIELAHEGQRSTFRIPLIR